jgi:serine/threonine protein phosphatase PrpC
MLEEDEIVTLLAHSVMDLGICVQSLIERANDAGGKDNISIILTRVPEPHRGKWFDRLLS